MVALSRKALFALHVTILILGPIVVLGLLTWVLVLTKDTFGECEIRRWEPQILTDSYQW